MGSELDAADRGRAARFAPALLAWFDVDGRKDLPWQREPDAVPRLGLGDHAAADAGRRPRSRTYDAFMQRFPDVRALAEAQLDEVLHLWSGLGYYARARNLHRAAQAVVREHGGEFPQTHR